MGGVPSLSGAGDTICRIRRDESSIAPLQSQSQSQSQYYLQVSVTRSDCDLFFAAVEASEDYHRPTPLVLLVRAMTSIKVDLVPASDDDA